MSASDVAPARAEGPVLDLSSLVLPSDYPNMLAARVPDRVALQLSGHTHGGQICLPGSIPITLDAVLPRRLGSGPWKYHTMVGYTSNGVGTSIVEVRFNCLPEITLHHLQCA